MESARTTIDGIGLLFLCQYLLSLAVPDFQLSLSILQNWFLTLNVIVGVRMKEFRRAERKARRDVRVNETGKTKVAGRSGELLISYKQ